VLLLLLLLLFAQMFKVSKEELQVGSLADGVVAKLAGREC
jgi:hypothetical protein